MDIDLLSKMVSELLVDHDEVGLPGVGAFVAEMVPASFSDRGFTIHPPYRRLSFFPGRTEDRLLIDFYAASNRMERETARNYLTQFLAELKSVLEQRKSITLPGLGRLRATRENRLFFIADEGLDIFPGGIGLRPVSLKSRIVEEDPVVIKLPLSLVETSAQTAPVREARTEAVPADEVSAGIVPALENPGSREVVSKSPEVPENPGGPGNAESPTDEAAGEMSGEGIAESPGAKSGEAVSGRPKKRNVPATVMLVLLATALVLLGVFILLAHLAPDFIDSILYSPEELRILHYPDTP